MPDRYHMNVTALESHARIGAARSRRLPPVTVGRLDLLPGNPAIIRSAVLSLRSPDGTTRVLGTWVPRQVPAAIALKPPVRIDPGSQIVARMHYKKTWKHEGQLMSDLSLVGLVLRGLSRDAACAARPFSSPVPGSPASPLRASCGKRARRSPSSTHAIASAAACSRCASRFSTVKHAEAGADLIDESQTEIFGLIAAVGLRTAEHPAGRLHVGQAGRPASPHRRQQAWKDLAKRLQPEVRAFCVSEQRWDGGVAASLARESVAQWLDRIRAPQALKDVAIGSARFFSRRPRGVVAAGADRSVRRRRCSRQREDVPHRRRQRSPSCRARESARIQTSPADDPAPRHADTRMA